MYDMKLWFATFFWPPKMGGRYLKTPFLATRRPKMKKRRVHCFLKLLKMKRWTRKKNWFFAFLTPYPQKCHFWPKTPFLATRGKKRKEFQWIHMSISYIKILYDMGFWVLTFFRSTLWPPEPIFGHFEGPKKFEKKIFFKKRKNTSFCFNFF